MQPRQRDDAIMPAACARPPRASPARARSGERAGAPRCRRSARRSTHEATTRRRWSTLRKLPTGSPTAHRARVKIYAHAGDKVSDFYVDVSCAPVAPMKLPSRITFEGRVSIAIFAQSAGALEPRTKLSLSRDPLSSATAQRQICERLLVDPAYVLCLRARTARSREVAAKRTEGAAPPACWRWLPIPPRFRAVSVARRARSGGAGERSNRPPYVPVGGAAPLGQALPWSAVGSSAPRSPKHPGSVRKSNSAR